MCDLPWSAYLRKTVLVRQCPTRFGADVDTTLTVRLDTQLKNDAERTLDSLGLSMSSAIRVFLTHVVAQKALPFPVQAAPVQTAADVHEALAVPLHVHIEVMLEEIAVISARLQQMEQAEQAPEKRKELREIGKAVRAMRFQFDPYNEVEVMAMVRTISKYAKAIQPALQPTHR
ncbi:MAG: type II toxin-antitoxin system RelB/DinJ family antitoxin, partial [Rubrivivax sp.]